MKCWLAVLTLALAAQALAAPSAEPEGLPDSSYADAQFDLLELASLAEQGDARAAYLLGTRYASGRGGIRDDSQAVRWFTVAAERDLPEAQYNLGVMHATGRGTLRDVEQAARWFELAAEQGYAEAQHALGTMYAMGSGVERDEARAATWLRKAAEQGDARAQYNLGVLYEFGRGVGMDASQAQLWFERAAAIGYEPAAERLASIRARIAAAGAQAGAASPKSRREAVAAPSTATGKLFPGAPDDHYTIQLASHTSAEDARGAVRRYRLGEAAAVLRTEVKGRTWFVLCYGHYPEQAAAEAAVAALPERLRKGKPWIRRLGDIRALAAPGG